MYRMYKRAGWIVSLALAAAAFSAPASAGATEVFHDFEVNNDVQGWQMCQLDCTTAPTYSTTNGLPAGPGHIEGVDTIADDQAGGLLSFQHTGLALNAANYGGTWSFNFKTNGHADNTLILKIFNTNDDQVFRSIPLPELFPAEPWQTVSVPLSESGWFYLPDLGGGGPATQADVINVLGSFSDAVIQADYSDGTTEYYALDNVRFTDGPATVTPTPTPTPIPTPTPPATGPTGQRAAALKKCAKKKGKAKKKKCKKRARALPV